MSWMLDDREAKRYTVCWFSLFFTVEFHLINEVVLLRFFDFLSVWITRDRLAWVSKR